jgi:hypothetical protein
MRQWSKLQGYDSCSPVARCTVPALGSTAVAERMEARCRLHWQHCIGCAGGVVGQTSRTSCLHWGASHALNSAIRVREAGVACGACFPHWNWDWGHLVARLGNMSCNSMSCRGECLVARYPAQLPFDRVATWAVLWRAHLARCWACLLLYNCSHPPDASSNGSKQLPVGFCLHDCHNSSQCTLLVQHGSGHWSVINDNLWVLRISKITLAERSRDQCSLHGPVIVRVLHAGTSRAYWPPRVASVQCAYR